MTPRDRLYTEDHDWIQVVDGVLIMGITDHAQDQLGDITFVDLPVVGMEVEAHAELTVIESVKTAVDVYAPVAGKISAVNEILEEVPDMINNEPYSAGWICKIVDFDESELDKFMNADAYKIFLDED